MKSRLVFLRGNPTIKKNQYAHKLSEDYELPIFNPLEDHFKNADGSYKDVFANKYKIAQSNSFYDLFFHVRQNFNGGIYVDQLDWGRDFEKFVYPIKKWVSRKTENGVIDLHIINANFRFHQQDPAYRTAYELFPDEGKDVDSNIDIAQFFKKQSNKINIFSSTVDE